MRKVKTLEISLIEDRDVFKWRVNLVKGNRIFGCLKPTTT